jgi:hypothetical protein
MNEIKRLPNRTIIGSGCMSIKFRDLGIHDFHHACEWIRDLPYGYNSNPSDPYSVFIERRGICTTKHGAIALLAQELDLDVRRMLGFYRLNERIVSGTGEILKTHGLSYIPQTHCFLDYHTDFVDLTEDNCHAKKKRLDEFDLILRAQVDLNEMKELELYKVGLDYYMMNDEKLASMKKEDLITILQECDENHKRRCPNNP